MAHRAVLSLLAGGLVIVTRLASAQIPAFPGADGAAAFASGGRGGIVYHVTKLNSAIDDPARNDPGTIRYGLNNANFPAGVPRTIVFDVGGVFHLGRLSQAGWDPNGNGWDAQSRLTIGGTNITLAGQTAPGAGVIFMGGGLKPQGNNNILRNVTVAAGYGLTGWWKPGDPFPGPPGPATDPDASKWFPDNVVYDAMDISGTNLMIDHVSTLYATDETISMNEVANHITVQYSNISQGQNYPQWDAEGGGLTGHALGSLLEAGSGSTPAAISFHHNLYAHLKGRVPQMQKGGVGGYYDFRNNVFYNWFGTAGSKSGTTFLNLVNNFYLAGDGGDQPVGGTNPGITTQGGGTGVISASSTVYRNGNLLDSNKDDDANDGVPLPVGGAANPHWANGLATYAGVTDSATQAFDRVLDFVGARWWTRDGLIDTPDERIIHEARTGTGKIIAWADDPWNNDPNEGVEWRALKNTPPVERTADWDTEADVGYGTGDGMPTWWELAHGLDPNARDDAGDFDNDGYTNLEEYLNEIAEWPAPKPLVFTGTENSRYAQINNWDIRWQPSKYDEAQINSGTAVVDAVGQHARALKIAAGSGDSATLNVTDGWLRVEEEVAIGTNASSGTLNLSGGLLSTHSLSKGASSAFNFTGGTLQADVVNFDLVNNGGTIAPGMSPGTTVVNGDLTLQSGTLEIEIGGTQDGQYDRLEVHGETTLGGTLRVKLLELNTGPYEPQLGDTFGFLAAYGGGSGEFDALDVPPLPIGLAWAVAPGDVTYFLSVVAAPLLPGDFNNDGTVDAADYSVWRKGLGTTYTQADYDTWQANFGRTAGSGATADVPSSANTPIPEPASAALILFAAVAGTALRARQSAPTQHTVGGR